MDLEVLEFVLESEHELFDQLVDQSRTTMSAATGVAKKLIGNGGNLEELSDKQFYVYEKCIEPLFTVPCSGVYGEGTCTGNEYVDDESLLMSYQEDHFLCQHCRFDSERH